MLAGTGIACLPGLLVAPLVASEKRVQVLETFCRFQPGFFWYSQADTVPAFKAWLISAYSLRPSPFSISPHPYPAGHSARGKMPKTAPLDPLLRAGLRLAYGYLR